MNIKTKNFGLVSYNEEDVLNFDDGIPGFEGLKSFILLSVDEYTPFKWLQSLDDTNIAFVIIDPKVVVKDYKVEINEETVKLLDIKDLNHILVFAIVVIPDEIEKMTANLKAPIIINAENNKGMQILLDNDDYMIKHPILKELKNADTHS
ncbi:flagellar assembly protein FliW [Thermoanaerobacterium thermosaccharolyticum]|uniref:flagellar assembly protein FliW n=1 Tax=Thermoanaerobacterium thermosaccharolyticum TaxID=1517 RepID=UPI00177ABBED|nr:flagellar assembly protein FliW [Thermoanaerobacterium thermosaccharolyticum]MBE0067766.1 flagellar assembly protein FliW [Thermoanaerobacterium thermosaccharolyticum]MBE0227329.1 flagellar assembly protein FliW [Thermoanaerobacterium thermosaccharolyticum]